MKTILSTIPNDDLSALVAQAVGIPAMTPPLAFLDVSECDEPNEVPDFAGRVDEILPLLDSYAWSARTYQEGVRVMFSRPIGVNGITYGCDSVQPTLARAFCFALLKSQGFKEITSP